MRKLILLNVFVFTVLSFQAQELKIMTYNIKLLKFYEPDILGIQEAMPNQMKDIDGFLEDYDFVGVGRDDGKDQGEYSAIFYKRDKFKVLESSTFWLSETPDKVSIGWDASFKRICTYVLFDDLETKHKFWVFNTHLDHIGIEARKNSTILIIDKIKELNKKGFPVILTGDFNMEPDDESIHYVLEYLRDSKSVSKTVFGPNGTFNGFQFDQPVIRRIDYIFVSETVSVEKYAVLSDSWDLKYPSDHFPVFIIIKLKD